MLATPPAPISAACWASVPRSSGGAPSVTARSTTSTVPTETPAWPTTRNKLNAIPPMNIARVPSTGSLDRRPTPKRTPAPPMVIIIIAVARVAYAPPMSHSATSQAPSAIHSNIGRSSRTAAAIGRVVARLARMPAAIAGRAFSCWMTRSSSTRPTARLPCPWSRNAGQYGILRS